VGRDIGVGGQANNSAGLAMASKKALQRRLDLAFEALPEEGGDAGNPWD